MHFNRAENSFIIFSDQGGLSVVSLEGKILFKDENFKTNDCNADAGLFLQALDKTILICELTKQRSR